MNEWGVVTVLTALVGLFFTVGKPIINLNKTMTTLNINVEHNSQEVKELKDDLKSQRESAHESHEKLWMHNNKQDEKLQDHETRLGILEHK